MRLACTAAPWPTSTDLFRAPELAALAHLDHALELIGRVLVVANPDILGVRTDDPDRESKLSTAALCADELLVLRERMRIAIRDYRKAAAPLRPCLHPDDSGYPF
jgi:hypothetical protein